MTNKLRKCERRNSTKLDSQAKIDEYHGLAEQLKTFKACIVRLKRTEGEWSEIRAKWLALRSCLRTLRNMLYVRLMYNGRGKYVYAKSMVSFKICAMMTVSRFHCLAQQYDTAALSTQINRLL